jgi:starch synthase (maltosyl-transferring)
LDRLVLIGTLGSAVPQPPPARVVVERILPEIDGGRFPVKRTVGEAVRVIAWIHADGHEALAAVVRYRTVPGRGRRGKWLEQPMQPLGNDEWTATFVVDRQRQYEYTVEAWIDRFGSWRHGLAAKVEAGQEVSSELLEGSALLKGVAARARAARARPDARWIGAQADLMAASDLRAATSAALGDRLAATAGRFPDRANAGSYDRILKVSVDRTRARCGAWYEMFPRSWGPDSTRSATFREAAAHLPRVAAMGFDVVYLPPIHPIGTTFRKGRGNALRAAPGDPGSPWAIGSEAGGHKAVDPALGTLEDFDHFAAEARRLGLEVAIDIAFQCSPDHPYVRDHPEWFRHRPNGTIKYAENPPKKYQDIYPFDFECAAWSSLWDELKSVVAFWAARGILIFRVDNPHTKPYAFWEWLISEIRSDHPDAIFLAEAFTRPKVMYRLAKLGFNQSYTYFTWRNTKEELTEYLTELTQTETAQFFRPNLFANTPDILHAYLQNGGPPAFRIRLLLASMLGANYGIYSGFELCEHRAVPGTEEYLDSEKYQIRRWDSERATDITDLVAAVNRIRHDNPALHSNDSLTFCATDNPQIIAFYKLSPDRSNAIFVVVNLDYERMQHGWVAVPVDRLGLPPAEAYEVVDLLDGGRFTWRGDRNYVRLDPRERVAHVLKLPIASPEVAALTGGALVAFLPRQRWFAGKARTMASARILDLSPAEPPSGSLIPVIAGVAYEDGVTERYFVPVAVVAAAGAPAVAASGAIARTAGFATVDALEDDGACRTLAVAMLEGQTFAMQEGVARSTVYSRASPPDVLPVVRGAVEQSNSCIRLGDRYLLKVIRRLEPGPHPELEMLRFLARSGFESIPRLLASLEYERVGEEATTLAVMQTFVTNKGTAWHHAVEDARAFIERVPVAPAADAIGWLESAAALGETTAELHIALASSDEDPAFIPEPFTGEAAAAMVADMRAGATRALSRLGERVELMAGPARDRARDVLAARAAIDRRLGLGESAPAGSLRTRVHGDYHLGQVLAAGTRFVVIDFEGEPVRPLPERRAKHAPVKDVAGMLRSFSYAAHQAALSACQRRPDLAGELAARASAWEAAVAGAFLAGYRLTTAGTGLAPSDAGAFERLLGAFVLEKALYEVEYELASRPDWVIIPLLGILQILNAPASARDQTWLTVSSPREGS